MIPDLAFVVGIRDRLLMGSLEDLNKPEVVARINQIVTDFLQKQEYDIEVIKTILVISNIVYNNTDRNRLFLEDGIYDLAINQFNKITGGLSPVGAPPVSFPCQEDGTGPFQPAPTPEGVINPFHWVDTNNMIYFDDIGSYSNQMLLSDFSVEPPPMDYILGRGFDPTSSYHKYPELAGTIDKCQFTTFAETINLPEENKEKVEVFEKYFHDNYQKGLEPPLVVSLKMDGVSVTASMNGPEIVTAVSRGDTANDEAQNLTHIFALSTFKRAEGVVERGTTFGIQFECIITDYKLELLRQNEGITYNNKRTAVIGLLGRKDARKYRGYLTLVPIRTSGIPELENDRVAEIEFLNRYYSEGVELPYAFINTNNYEIALFQVFSFVTSAEKMRDYLPFMYDGVVVEYTKPYVKEALGRHNSVNKWQKAIKFQAQKKISRLTDISYTVGYTGRVIPMAHFEPVEFFGGIHDKTTLHSYKRFKELGLKPGEFVQLEYRNDVILYLDKVDAPANQLNTNPPYEFPTVCPFCGTPLEFSDNVVVCPNKLCEEKLFRKASLMLAKLNFKDFSYETVKKLNIHGLHDLMTINPITVCQVLGDVLGFKFIAQIEYMVDAEYYDYRYFDALGFPNIGMDKWSKILQNVAVHNLINDDDETIRDRFLTIPGIGPQAVESFLEYRKLYIDDLMEVYTLLCDDHIISTFGDVQGKKITVRFTGCRDSQLCEALNKTGKFDASGTKGVTKITDILVVPYEGYTSSKLSKIGPGTRVLTLEEMRAKVNL